MHHKVTVTKGTAHGRPYHAQCSCGTAGDFGGMYDSQQYFIQHFRGLSGICTSEFTVSPEVMDEVLEKADAVVHATEAAAGTLGDA